ncbi:unnamed protein product [Amoebophrya sp. A25]|nr:unnamed protein product [Amoebophrya sp. A25]|eukprot:GSA25T00006778001.1
MCCWNNIVANYPKAKANSTSSRPPSSSTRPTSKGNIASQELHGDLVPLHTVDLYGKQEDLVLDKTTGMLVKVVSNPSIAIGELSMPGWIRKAAHAHAVDAEAIPNYYLNLLDHAAETSTRFAGTFLPLTLHAVFGFFEALASLDNVYLLLRKWLHMSIVFQAVDQEQRELQRWNHLADMWEESHEIVSEVNSESQIQAIFFEEVMIHFLMEISDKFYDMEPTPAAFPVSGKKPLSSDEATTPGEGSAIVLTSDTRVIAGVPTKQASNSSKTNSTTGPQHGKTTTPTSSISSKLRGAPTRGAEGRSTRKRDYVRKPQFGAAYVQPLPPAPIVDPNTGLRRGGLRFGAHCVQPGIGMEALGGSASFRNHGRGVDAVGVLGDGKTTGLISPSAGGVAHSTWPATPAYLQYGAHSATSTPMSGGYPRQHTTPSGNKQVTHPFSVSSSSSVVAVTSSEQLAELEKKRREEARRAQRQSFRDFFLTRRGFRSFSTAQSFFRQQTERLKHVFLTFADHLEDLQRRLAARDMVYDEKEGKIVFLTQTRREKLFHDMESLLADEPLHRALSWALDPEFDAGTMSAALLKQAELLLAEKTDKTLEVHAHQDRLAEIVTHEALPPRASASSASANKNSGSAGTADLLWDFSSPSKDRINAHRSTTPSSSQNMNVTEGGERKNEARSSASSSASSHDGSSGSTESGIGENAFENLLPVPCAASWDMSPKGSRASHRDENDDDNDNDNLNLNLVSDAASPSSASSGGSSWLQGSTPFGSLGAFFTGAEVQKKTLAPRKIRSTKRVTKKEPDLTPVSSLVAEPQTQLQETTPATTLLSAGRSSQVAVIETTATSNDPAITCSTTNASAISSPNDKSLAEQGVEVAPSARASYVVTEEQLRCILLNSSSGVPRVPETRSRPVLKAINAPETLGLTLLALSLTKKTDFLFSNKKPMALLRKRLLERAMLTESGGGGR